MRIPSFNSIPQFSFRQLFSSVAVCCCLFAGIAAAPIAAAIVTLLLAISLVMHGIIYRRGGTLLAGQLLVWLVIGLSIFDFLYSSVGHGYPHQPCKLRVTSAATGAPIANATVSLNYDRRFQPAGGSVVAPTEIQTTLDGEVILTLRGTTTSRGGPFSQTTTLSIQGRLGVVAEGYLAKRGPLGDLVEIKAVRRGWVWKTTPQIVEPIEIQLQPN